MSVRIAQLADLCVCRDETDQNRRDDGHTELRVVNRRALCAKKTDVTARPFERLSTLGVPVLRLFFRH